MTDLPKSSAITRLCDPVDMDGGMLRARRKAAIRSVVDGRTTLARDNFSGRLGELRTELAETLLRSGFVPVVSPPAIDEHDHPVNVDDDRVAAREALTGGVGVGTHSGRTGIRPGQPSTGRIRHHGDDEFAIRSLKRPTSTVQKGSS